MDVHILNAQDLFMKPIHYVIPEFQRRYVWRMEEQWDPFWEDVSKVAEEYLDKPTRLGDEQEEQTQTKSHFLGAVIIQKQLGPITEPTKRKVIDGQQRLTTLQLLLDAIQWVCENHNNPNVKQSADLLTQFVTNNEKLYKDKYIFKLWPSKFDQDTFKHVMNNKLDVGNFKGSRIAQAHEFFQQQVEVWLNAVPEGQTKNRIDALVEAVTTGLQIAVIELDIQADPHIIFETLNARGTPLAEFELIKNFVMSKAQKPTSDIWGNLDGEWWKKEVRQGRLRRPRLDMLFNYWLAMHKESDISPSKVFDEFRNQPEAKADAKEHKIYNLMHKIIEDFENYKKYDQTERPEYEKESFQYHMDVMQAGVITPVLFLLLSKKTGTHTNAFDALESFLIRRMICRYTTKDYNRMILDLCHQLKPRLGESDTFVVKFLQKQDAESRKWPRDDEVKNALVSLPLYRLLSKGRLRVVLEGVEQQLRDPRKTEQLHILGKTKDGKSERLTIEHMMPVGWNENNWPLGGIDIEKRNTLINTIGNLTLVTRPLNSSMSNVAWDIKRAELQEHSRLMLNKELAPQLAPQSSWNERDIEARSLRMAKLVSERWPGPDSQVWDN